MIETGNGLFTNDELIDTIILDINSIGKQAASANYIGVCNTVVHMVQKLTNLKKGIVNDMKRKDDVIEDLKQQLKLYNPGLTDVTPKQFLEDIKKDGEANGDG